MTSLPVSRRTLLAGAGIGLSLPFVRLQGAAAKTPDSLTFGLSSFPPSIQPWSNTGTAAATVKLMIYRGLTSYADDGSLQPELAESWARDGEAGWLFKLRDARFQNGEKVTSADVKWTIEQVAAERSTAYLRTEMQGVAQVDTPDDRTVRIVMKRPSATLPILMASYHLPIICRTSPAGSFVGAGPFKIKSQERGTSIDLERSANFYKPGLPKLATIRVIAYADETARVAALKAGDVDLIEYVPWQAMESLEKSATLKLDAVDGPFMYLLFNGSRAPFNDPRIRRAVAHAVRREDIVQSVFFGRGSPLQQLPLSASSPFYNPEYKNGWAYDPAMAKKLLAEGGHPNGFNCTLLATSQYGMHKSSAEIVQQNLAAIGVNAQLSLADWATTVTAASRGQYDIAMAGNAADSNDPDGIASFIDGTLSPSNYRSFDMKNDRITELLAAGRAEFDQDKRRLIYRELEGVVIEQAPIVGLAWRSQGYAMDNSVTGFRNLPGALTTYSGMTFERAMFG